MMEENQLLPEEGSTGPWLRLWEMAGTGLALRAATLHALTLNNLLDLTGAQFPVQDFCLLTLPCLGKSEITSLKCMGCSDTTQAMTYMAGWVEVC